jgi:hypothetical protein
VLVAALARLECWALIVRDEKLSRVAAAGTLPIPLILVKADLRVPRSTEIKASRRPEQTCAETGQKSAADQVSMRRRPQCGHSGSVDRLSRPGLPCSLDDAGEGLDVEGGERHDAVVAWTVDPDQAVLMVHFVGDVPRPILGLAEHPGNAGNGVIVVG